MQKRIEAGGSYSPQDLLAIGLELQRQNDQLSVLVSNQASALLAQRQLLDQADEASGIKHAVAECTDVYRRAVETWGPLLQVRMLAEESAELTVAALKMLRDGGGTNELRRLGEEIADVTIMIQQAFLLYPGLAIAASCEQTRKIDRLKERLDRYDARVASATAEAEAAEAAS